MGDPWKVASLFTNLGSLREAWVMYLRLVSGRFRVGMRRI